MEEKREKIMNRYHYHFSNICDSGYYELHINKKYLNTSQWPKRCETTWWESWFSQERTLNPDIHMIPVVLWSQIAWRMVIVDVMWEPNESHELKLTKYQFIEDWCVLGRGCLCLAVNQVRMYSYTACIYDKIQHVNLAVLLTSFNRIQLTLHSPCG